MVRRPIDLPPAAARTFMEDLQAYLNASTGLEKDAIAARQLRTLREFVPGRLRLMEVRELFETMSQELSKTGTKKSPAPKRGAKSGRTPTTRGRRSAGEPAEVDDERHRKKGEPCRKGA